MVLRALKCIQLFVSMSFPTAIASKTLVRLGFTQSYSRVTTITLRTGFIFCRRKSQPLFSLSLSTNRLKLHIKHLWFRYGNNDYSIFNMTHLVSVSSKIVDRRSIEEEDTTSRRITHQISHRENRIYLYVLLRQ